MKSIRRSLHLAFLASLLFIVLVLNGSDARTKSSMKLRIPYAQRASCLAKLLCGIQAQSTSSAGTVAYTNQAHLLRKFFQTYELPELEDKPLKSKSSAGSEEEDELDLDDSATSEESDESSAEEVVKVKKPAVVTPKTSTKKQEKEKVKVKVDKKKTSTFDTGVPIVEKPTHIAAAVQQQKGKRHWTPINQELTVRVARQLATKNVKNCNVIQGCGFTFRQIFVSLQEDSNVIGSEAIAALSSANFEGPIAETNQDELKKATANPVAAPEEEMEPVSEYGHLRPPTTATASYSLPPIVINENEDEVENEDIKLSLSAVENLFLSTDHVLNLPQREKEAHGAFSSISSDIKSPSSTKKKTRRPVSANTKKEQKDKEVSEPLLGLRRTTAKPEVIPYEYHQLNTHSRSKGSKTKPQRLNYKTPTALPLALGKKGRPLPTTTEGTTTTTEEPFPTTQVPIFAVGQLNKRKKPKPIQQRPNKHEFQQEEENYDDSRDTYDEEEELENPSADDYGEDLDDVTLEDGVDVEDDEDDEALEQHGGGGWGGENDKKKPKPPKQKKKKIKKKKNKKKKNKKKKNKNKNYKKKPEQVHQGWGWGQQQRPVMTEIGGRPLVPPPEPQHPDHGIFNQQSGWATMYRREPPPTMSESELLKTKDEKQSSQSQSQSQLPSSLFSSFGSVPKVPIALPMTGSSNSTKNAARSEGEVEDHQQHQYRPMDQVPAERVTGFSFAKLASPFTNLVKVFNANMRGSGGYGSASSFS